jgi:hypothetical protein
MPSTNQKARTEHLGRASQPPPVHPRLEVGGAELRAIRREPVAEVATSLSVLALYRGSAVNVPAPSLCWP